MAAHREAIQKQIHQDWANREYIEVITASIKRITDFLNSFGSFNSSFSCPETRLIRPLTHPSFADMSCRSKLAQLNEKLTTLERRIDYLESSVTKGDPQAGE